MSLHFYFIGEKIFSEGDLSFPFYIVVASDETVDIAEVEVLKDAGGSERLMTRLHRGLFFFLHSFLSLSLLNSLLALKRFHPSLRLVTLLLFLFFFDLCCFLSYDFNL